MTAVGKSLKYHGYGTGKLDASSDRSMNLEVFSKMVATRISETTVINLAVLDTMIKHINLALQWQMTALHQITDPEYIHRWIS